ncbi:MAG: HAMP domain-containing sensor histidine kinase [Coriobacteriia bacterium]|nr:HAMP domain-containing sensor histidine kinase [Coriobacteriia bacterium]
MRSRRSVASRARLYLVLAALIALVVAFAVFAVGWSQYSIRQRADDLSRQVAALAKGQAVASQLATGTTDARDRLFKVEAGLIGAELFVTDSAGVVQLASSSSPPTSLPISRLTRVGAEQTRTGTLRNASGAQVLVVASAIDSGHELVAVQGLSEIRSAQAGLLVVAGIALLAAALVAYAAGGLLAKRFTGPLVRLQAAAEEVAGGALGTQVAEEGDAETASLARSFNRMSTRVADAYAAQKAFVGDVSHEIRTPLTSIRGFAEAMLDGTVTQPDARVHALSVIRDEATRIGEVSQTLLALSELDAGAVQIARVPVDLGLVGDALRGRFSAVAEEAGVALDIELPDGLRPVGDSERLLQALSALVANAIAYTPSGGQVQVSVVLQSETVALRVDDSGPGIPAERREDVFGRFTRLEASRASSGGGAGLGLAICRRLVELMGGTVVAGQSDLGGARFEIELPAAV